MHPFWTVKQFDFDVNLTPTLNRIRLALQIHSIIHHTGGLRHGIQLFLLASHTALRSYLWTFRSILPILDTDEDDAALLDLLTAIEDLARINSAAAPRCRIIAEPLENLLALLNDGLQAQLHREVRRRVEALLPVLLA